MAIYNTKPQPIEDNVYKVKTFTEKPNLDLAKTFLKVAIFYGMRDFYLES